MDGHLIFWVVDVNYQLKYRMPIQYDTTEDKQNKKITSFILILSSN